MNYNALIIVLVFSLIFFVWCLFKLWSTPKGKSQKVSTSGGHINIEVRRESDGIHLVIPDVVPMEDDSESIIPDIINDAAPEDHGLGPDFWEKVARMPESEDPVEREQLAQKLAAAGIISKENIPVFALLGESADIVHEEEPLPAPGSPDSGHEASASHDIHEVEEEYPDPEPYPDPQIQMEPLPSPYDEDASVIPSPETSSGPSAREKGDFANHIFNYK